MRTYELMATPLVYSGQQVSARVVADANNARDVTVAFRILVYGGNDALHAVDGEWTNLSRCEEAVLGWRLLDLCGQPRQSVRLALRSNAGAEQGAVVLDWLRWGGPRTFGFAAPTNRAYSGDAPG